MLVLHLIHALRTLLRANSLYAVFNFYGARMLKN
jgi:hypothetical protein